ncbi:M23 family metallopeptidase [Schaalia sp. 19OD2882]|uniref:M23 family metallopeptidase n=1 Tax=Schaalia sp. 19OD2882 TaxID=2794089 RepID=UPI001C1EC6A2|nr:M23 family metallopeptidase [Schaalia sp. 19OD2882]QWW18815.1 M23 family metallopeptidase [Schaalia sp. 19OD2882]
MGHETYTRKRRAFAQMLALLAMVCAALAPSPLPTHAVAARATWSWPTGHPVPVVRAFDPPDMPWLAGHRGVDLDVPVGSIVVAPAEGRVVHAGDLAGRGVLSIEHMGPLGAIRSTYEPVKATVVVGQMVSRGQQVAVVEEGHSPGALHWGAKTSRTHYVDPLRMLAPKVVLKPWEGSLGGVSAAFTGARRMAASTRAEPDPVRERVQARGCACR